jgi:hypothetical protein
VLGWILRDATREIDSVSYAAESHTYVIVLPETDAQGARAAAHRLSDLFEKRSSVALSVGVAAFPSDGLTVEDLFHHASAALERVIAGTNAPNDRPPANAAALDRRRAVDASAVNGHGSGPTAPNGHGSKPAALNGHGSEPAVLNGHRSAETAASAGPANTPTAPTIGTTPTPTVGTSSSNTPAPGAAPPVDGTEGATPARRASDMPVITPPHDPGKARVMRRASNG